MKRIGFDDLPPGQVPDGYAGLDWHRSKHGFAVFSAAKHPELSSGITSGNEAIVSHGQAGYIIAEQGQHFSVDSLELTTPGWSSCTILIAGEVDGNLQYVQEVKASDQPTLVALDWSGLSDLEFLREDHPHRDRHAADTKKIFVIDDLVLGSAPSAHQPAAHFHETADLGVGAHHLALA